MNTECDPLLKECYDYGQILQYKVIQLFFSLCKDILTQIMNIMYKNSNALSFTSYRKDILNLQNWIPTSTNVNG